MSDPNLAALKNLNIPILDQPSLSDFTTFRLGGSCPALLDCQTPQQLHQAILFCVQEHHDFILIGGGSNLVVADEGISCDVIRYFSASPLIERRGNELLISGSTLLDQVVAYAVLNGLEGINYCAGIPGTVGGAIVGNAGAFGRQIGDVIKDVDVIDQKGGKKILAQKDLGFAYRHSILKNTGDIIVAARLSLLPGNKNGLQKERDEILKIRREKHPDLVTHPCAGSFFRNVEPTSRAGKRQAAGWFLEQAGAKELTAGDARIFDKHANIIVNPDGCRSQDVFELSMEMARKVKDKFNLDLVREVRFVGKFKGMPDGVREMIW